MTQAVAAALQRVLGGQGESGRTTVGEEAAQPAAAQPAIMLRLPSLRDRARSIVLRLLPVALALAWSCLCLMAGASSPGSHAATAAASIGRRIGLGTVQDRQFVLPGRGTWRAFCTAESDNR